MNPKHYPMAVNATAGLLGFFLVAFVVHDFWNTDFAPMCHKRFGPQTEFGFSTKTSEPLSPAELQARVGGREFGILNNAAIVPAANAPSPLILQVKLPKGKGSVFNDPARAGGVSFRWDPRGMGGAESACLTYSIMLPEDFDFGSAGVLPGLYGGGTNFNPKIAADGKNGFATRVVWAANGNGNINLQVPTPDENDLSRIVGPAHFELPTGRWVSIEQEIALNTPGQSDGILRLWVNGELQIEMLDVLWRKDARLTLSGVLSDISYGNVDSDASAPADTMVNLTPLLVSWKENNIIQ